MPNSAFTSFGKSLFTASGSVAELYFTLRLYTLDISHIRRRAYTLLHLGTDHQCRLGFDLRHDSSRMLHHHPAPPPVPPCAVRSAHPRGATVSEIWTYQPCLEILKITPVCQHKNIKKFFERVVDTKAAFCNYSRMSKRKRLSFKQIAAMLRERKDFTVSSVSERRDALVAAAAINIEIHTYPKDGVFNIIYK